MSGDSFSLILPYVNMTTMQIFLDRFAAAFAETFNVLILDNSAVHTSKTLRLPSNVALVFLPPYSPELNPAERLWHDLRGRMAWQVFTNLDELESTLCTHLTQYTPAMVQSLTGYPYLRKAIDAVGPYPHNIAVSES